jgi:hypothetical protein
MAKQTESEWYAIPRTVNKNSIGIMPYYPTYSITGLLTGILDHYIDDEDKQIRDICDEHKIKDRIEIRQKLQTAIQRLNGFSGSEIPEDTGKIKIPTNLAFFQLAFPRYQLCKVSEIRISRIIGILDKLHFEPMLEAFVRGSENITSVNNRWSAAVEITDALHLFKIHTCKAADRGNITKAEIGEGIKIFQREYMEKQNPVLQYTTGGELCKNTIIAMNEALAKNWTRDLWFFYKRTAEIAEQEEFFINDEDIKDGVAKDTVIWAKEKDKGEIQIGELKISTYRGLSHRADKAKYSPANNDIERIINPISISEGGGYDSINEWDQVALSIGLYNWNRDKLQKILKNFKENSPTSTYNTLFLQYGLDVETSNFKIDGSLLPGNSTNWEVLRKLKFVYSFIRAAENSQFQETQLNAAKDWFTTVIAYNVTVNSITKKVKEYITSEYGLALVLDLSVNTGQGNVIPTVKTAVENVLSQNQDIVNDPSEWGDNEEEMIINEYINVRHNLTIFTEAETREGKIDNAGLSKSRDSYNE